MRSIPALIDGSIFKPVSLVAKADEKSSDKAPEIVVGPLRDEEKCIISPKALEALEERCIKDIRIVTDVSGLFPTPENRSCRPSPVRHDSLETLVEEPREQYALRV